MVYKSFDDALKTANVGGDTTESLRSEVTTPNLISWFNEFVATDGFSGEVNLRALNFFVSTCDRVFDTVLLDDASTNNLSTLKSISRFEGVIFQHCHSDKDRLRDLTSRWSTSMACSLRSALLTSRPNREVLWRFVYFCLDGYEQEQFIDDFLTFLTANLDAARIVWNLIDQNFSSKISNSAVSYPSDRFVRTIVDHAKDPSQLVAIFGDRGLEDQHFWNFLTENLLICRLKTPQISPKNGVRASKMVAGYAMLQKRSDLIIAFFNYLVELFCDHAAANFVDYALQHRTAIVLVDFCNAVYQISTPEEKKTIASSLTLVTRVPAAIADYLRISDLNKRQLGMVIGEMLLRRFPQPLGDPARGLVFDFDAADDLDYLAIKSIIEEVEPISVPSNEPSTSKNTDNPPKKKTILDSDDDDETIDEDEFYLSELCDFAEHNPEKCIEIRDCIRALGETEDPKKFFSGMHDLLGFLRDRSYPVEEIPTIIVNRIVNLDDRYALPHYEGLRQRILELVFARRPELLSHGVRLILSQDCCMMNRGFVLRAIVGAATLLSDGMGLDDWTEKAKIEENNQEQKVSAFERLTAVKLIGEDGILDNGRGNEKGRKNLFHSLAPQFIFPLIYEEVMGPHLNFLEKEDAVFLSKILLTVAVLIGLARNAPTIVSLCEALVQFIDKVKPIESEDVVESIIFSYGAIVQALSPSVFFSIFGERVCDWVEYLSALKESKVCESVPRLRQAIDATAFSLISSVQQMGEELARQEGIDPGDLRDE